MSRLYTVMRTAEEIAGYFDVAPAADVEVPSETIEGRPGLVVFENKGWRHLKALRWGFPRHTREMRLQGDPPGKIGLVADLTNPLWEHLVVDPRYRCLIPLTHFANPDGDPGEKTRTWFRCKDVPMTAWAGFCRNIEEQGPVFAGMTMTANDLVMPYNDRMPVLLDKAEWGRWLNGSIQDVIGFQFRDPIPSERMEIIHTDDAWRSGKLPYDPSAPNAQISLAL